MALPKDPTRRQIHILLKQGMSPLDVACYMGVEIKDIEDELSLTAAIDLESENGKLFEDDDLSEAANTIRELIRDPDAPAKVRMDAATFIINECKGRNDKNAADLLSNAPLDKITAAIERARQITALKMGETKAKYLVQEAEVIE